MEMQILDWVYNAVLLVGGYLLRTLWEAVQELKADLAKLREELPREYCIKAELDRRFDRMEQVLDKIWAKLDGKADKGHG